MHQTKKGNQWHFGMKAHIGVDADTGIVRSMSADGGQRPRCYGDAQSAARGRDGGVGRRREGVHKREENLGLGLGVEWRVAMRPGQRRKLEPESEEALAEKVKASVRAKVEHPFLRLKRLFGYAKVRYRGLAKNAERLALLFGLGNLLTAGGSTVGVVRVATGQCRSKGSIKSPTAQSGAKLKGVSAGQQVLDRSSHPSPLRQTQPRPKGLVQSIPSKRDGSSRVLF